MRAQVFQVLLEDEGDFFLFEPFDEGEDFLFRGRGLIIRVVLQTYFDGFRFDGFNPILQNCWVEVRQWFMAQEGLESHLLQTDHPIPSHSCRGCRAQLRAIRFYRRSEYYLLINRAQPFDESEEPSRVFSL